MSPTFSPACRALFLALTLPLTSGAINPAAWSIVQQVNRTDPQVVWNSPTAIDLGKMVWAYDYTLTKVTGTVSLPFGGSVTQDITDQIDPDHRAGSGDRFQLPAVLYNNPLVNADTMTSADVLIEILPTGFGRMTFANIQLGSVAVPIFGVRPIQRINVEASITVTGYNWGDYNRDGAVTAADYAAWQTDFANPLAPLADGNGDGLVTAADYTIWRDALSTPVAAAASVPEPRAILLTLLVLAGASRAWAVRRGSFSDRR